MLDMVVLLRSEIPSGICAKLRTVAASNNRVHMPWSLCNCLFAPHTYFCSPRTSRSWWITQSTQHHRRGCDSRNDNILGKSGLHVHIWPWFVFWEKILKTAVYVLLMKHWRDSEVRADATKIFVVHLQVSLEDINNGVTKRMKITRKRLHPNGSYMDEDKILTIEIKKGWKVVIARNNA